MSLEDLIREKIPFVYRKAGTGFEPVICQVCGDYKPRGGFKFENNTIVYSCFNCGKHGSFTEGETQINSYFREILNAFSIDNEQIDLVLSKNFFANGGLKAQNKEESTITLDTLTKKKSCSTPEVQLPPQSFKLTKDHSLWEYVVSRKVDNCGLPFFGSHDEKYNDRVIIPFYRNGKLVFWQARSISDDAKDRYLNPPGSRDSIIFGFDELHTRFDVPLFVVEGVFDAMPINGVALIGSKLSECKCEYLTKTRRRKVFVIDDDENGKELALKVLKLGWEITFPPRGYDDINKSVQHNGLSWTIYNLMNNISSGFEAETKVNLFCKKKNRR